MTPDEYQSIMSRIETLILLDPAMDSAECTELLYLTNIIHEYEKTTFPMHTPTAEEIEDFRREQMTTYENPQANNDRH